MSKSLGELPLPPGKGGERSESGEVLRNPALDPISAEIQAEIADHLTTAAKHLESRGLDSDTAQQQAQAKFGDAAVITRRCYWIKQGDTLMFRTAIILLLAILCLALGFTAFSSVRSQRQMAEQMALLAERLQAIAEEQRAASDVPAAAPAPAESKPLEITGSVYYSSPDIPSANTEVMVCRAGDGEIVRRVSTNDRGAFRSGPLTAGDYTLLAKGVKGPAASRLGVQTAPFYMYPGMPDAAAQIDATYHTGRIAVNLSRPLPKLEVAGKYALDSRLYLAAVTPRRQRTRWTAARQMPPRWPIYIDSPDASLQAPSADRGGFGASSSNLSSHRSTILLSNSDLAESSHIVFRGHASDLPAGSYSLDATLIADVLPHGYDEILAGRFSREGGFGGPLTSVQEWMSEQWIFGNPLGSLWHASLRNFKGFDSPQLPRFEHLLSSSNLESYAGAEIVENSVTRLHIEIPADIEERIAMLLESTTEVAEFEERVRKDSPFIRKLKITIVGTQPLTENETKLTAVPPAP